MCVIVMKPAGIVLDEKILKRCWDVNSHGAGFMYAQDGQLHIVKGLMTYEAFLEAFKAHGPEKKMVLHFRIHTHGSKGPDMTHPFWVHENEVGMAHNGIIGKMSAKATGQESDSALFAKELGLAFNDPWQSLKHPMVAEMVDTYIGNSKLVFLNAEGEHIIINEKAGDWSENVWYSNTSYKEYKSTKTSYNDSYNTGRSYNTGGTSHPSNAGGYVTDPEKKVGSYVTVKKYPVNFKGRQDKQPGPAALPVTTTPTTTPSDVGKTPTTTTTPSA